MNSAINSITILLQDSNVSLPLFLWFGDFPFVALICFFGFLRQGLV